MSRKQDHTPGLLSHGMNIIRYVQVYEFCCRRTNLAFESRQIENKFIIHRILNRR